MLSVIICTYNRSESLRRTLKSLEAMSVPPDLSWELIVVDNNSKDDTRATVEDFARTSGLNVRYFFEPEQGLSHARNTGVRESKGNLLSFIDDDVVVAKDWLVEIRKAFDDYHAACVGGRILLKDDVRKPEWWDERHDGPLGAFDIGDCVILAKANRPRMVGIGANISFRRSVFKKCGVFRTDLGRVGKRLLMGEEVELCERLVEKGETVIYYPKAVVYQCPSHERMTRQYLRRWYFRMGEFYSYLDDATQNNGIPKLFGVARWKYRLALGNLIKAFILPLKGRPKDAFCCQLELILFIGNLFGSVRKKLFTTETSCVRADHHRS